MKDTSTSVKSQLPSNSIFIEFYEPIKKKFLRFCTRYDYVMSSNIANRMMKSKIKRMDHSKAMIIRVIVKPLEYQDFIKYLVYEYRHDSDNKQCITDHSQRMLLNKVFGTNAIRSYQRVELNI